MVCGVLSCGLQQRLGLPCARAALAYESAAMLLYHAVWFQTGKGQHWARGLYRVVCAHVLLFDPSQGTLSLWLYCSSLHCVCFLVEQRCACSGCLEHNMPCLLGSFHCCLSCVDCVAFLWLLSFAHWNESYFCSLVAAARCWHVAHLACWGLGCSRASCSGSVTVRQRSYVCIDRGPAVPSCGHPVYCKAARPAEHYFGYLSGCSPVEDATRALCAAGSRSLHGCMHS